MQEEIAQARSQIEDLEEQNRTAQETNESLQADHSKLKTEHEQQSREVETLRSRTNLSQQNWLKERDELIQREAFAREEFETAKQAMQDWEVLAMEERSLRESLSEKVSELEDQLSNQREAYERTSAERDTQSQAVDGLQRALRDIQDGALSDNSLFEQSTNIMQHARKNCGSWLRTPSLNSKPYENSYRLQRKPRPLLSLSCQSPKKSSLARYLSKRKSRRRIF
jgi:chromosome segregation ATPase